MRTFFKKQGLGCSNIDQRLASQTQKYMLRNGAVLKEMNNLTSTLGKST